RRHWANLASIEALQSGRATAATPSAEQLHELFTVAEVRIGRLTAVRPEGLKVYVTPIDAAGDVLKSAGTLTVEVFDLARGQAPLVGRWDFTTAGLAGQWYESAFVTGYAVTVPLDRPLSAVDLTVKVTFKDLLTQRTL